MPAGAPPSGEVSSRVTGTEALESFNPTAAKVTVDAERVNFLAQQAEKRLKEQGGREGLAAAVENKPITFTQAQTVELGQKFGAGFKKDASGNYPAGTPEEAQKNAAEAERVAGSLGKWQEYARLLDEQESTGVAPKDLSAAKAEAIKALIENSNLRSMVPGVGALATPELTQLIDDQMAKDPKLRRKITDKLLLLKQRVDFRDIADDPELNIALSRKGELTAQQRATTTELRDALKKLGADIKPRDTVFIADLIQRGLPTEVILNRLDDRLLHDVTNFPEVETFNQIAKARKDAAELRGIIRNAPAGSADVEQQQYDALILSADNLEKGIKDPTSYEMFNKIRSALSAQKDASGIYQNRAAQQIAELVQVNRNLEGVETTINSKQALAESAKNRSIAERLANETQVLEEFKDIFPTAVNEILLDRYDALDQADKNAQISELSKQMQDAIVAFRTNMGDVWIGRDDATRKRLVDDTRRGNIIEDVRLVAEKSATGNPEEAFQQIAIEFMGFPTRDINSNGTVENRAPQTYNELTDDEKKKFDAVYQQEGQAMKDKLFRDFYAQRELMGWGKKKMMALKESLPGVDTMGLNDQEWADLGEKVESLLATGSKKAKSSHDILAGLEANGLKVDHKDRFKLLSIIGILIGGVVLTGGVAGVAGIAGGVIKETATAAAVGMSGL